MSKDIDHSSKKRKNSVPDIRDVVVFGKATKFKENLKAQLHYLVVQSLGPNNKLGFMAYGLEFGINAWSETESNSIDNLISLTKSFLKNRTDEDIYYVLSGQFAQEYWALYRRLSFLIGDLHEKIIQENSELKKQNAELRANSAESEEKVTMITIEKNILQDAFDRMKEQYGSTTH